ncbi:acyltransferase family protein [Mesorhizobium sp. 1B3]|uniref:acyltransferase family protein n=1 Tax=Mesorhizobium sp. 1B3 TaxID=3243599 RepID=UPI003D97D087
MTKLFGIQYLRAVAALAVVVFHAAERSGQHFAVGMAGVDIFFVISGFVMWVLASTRPVSMGAFYRDRLLRVAPLYWIVTLIMAVGALAGLFPRIQLTADHVAASLAFIPHRSPSNGEIWPLLVQGWTLNLEMFFYLIFGLVLLLPRQRRLPALSTVFVGLVLAGWYFRPVDPIPATFTRPIILEFLCGAILGKLWLDGRLLGRAMGTVAIAVACAGFTALAFFPRPLDELFFGLLAIALVAGAVSVEKSGPIRRWPWLSYLGDASYSIYLWHTLAISVAAKTSEILSLGALPTLVLGVTGGTALGILSYELLEKPLLTLVKSRRRAGAKASIKPRSSEAG